MTESLNEYPTNNWIGKDVWFFNSEWDQGRPINAAKITGVSEKRLFNLIVFLPNGIIRDFRDVPYWDSSAPYNKPDQYWKFPRDMLLLGPYTASKIYIKESKDREIIMGDDVNLYIPRDKNGQNEYISLRLTKGQKIIIKAENENN